MEKILSEMRQIGFTGFTHLDKKKRDGKKRWTWSRAIENEEEWFFVLLVEDDGSIMIERLANPLGITFEADKTMELIKFIRMELIK